jgi:hypothetical protein
MGTVTELCQQHVRRGLLGGRREQTRPLACLPLALTRWWGLGLLYWSEVLGACLAPRRRPQLGDLPCAKVVSMAEFRGRRSS